MSTHLTGRDKDVAIALRGVHFFAGWPETAMQRINAAAQLWQFEKDEIIADRNGPAMGLWAVAAGSATTFRSSSNGKYLLQGVHWPGGVFGLTAAVDGFPMPFSHMARTDCVVVFIPRAVLEGVMQESNEALRRIAAYLCGRARVEYEALYSTAVETLRCRVAKYLAYLPARSLFVSGEPAGSPEWQEPARVDLTQEELAAMLGVARQTLNRTIGTFVRDKIVMREGSGIRVVNFRGLLAVIEENEPLLPIWRAQILSWDEQLRREKTREHKARAARPEPSQQSPRGAG